MQLKELKIERKQYGSEKGQFVGMASFDNEIGVVSIKLTPKKCNELFMLCAEGIIDTAKTAAQELTCSVIEHKAELEHKI